MLVVGGVIVRLMIMLADDIGVEDRLLDSKKEEVWFDNGHDRWIESKNRFIPPLDDILSSKL